MNNTVTKYIYNNFPITDEGQSIDKGGDAPDPENFLELTGHFSKSDISPVDLGLDEVVSSYSVADDGFSPFHIEYLVSTGLSGLESCISLRADAQSLESSLRTTVIDLVTMQVGLEALSVRYNGLGTRVASLEKKVAELSTLKTESQKRLDDIMSDNSNSSLNAKSTESAFLGEIGIRLSSVAADIVSMNSERDSVGREYSIGKAKLELLTKYQSETGNSFNYRQRVERVRAVFVRNFETAYRRLRTAAIGSRAIWPGRNDIPTFKEATEEGYLDILLEFAQDMSDWLDAQMKDSLETTIFYSVRQGLHASTKDFKLIDDVEGLKFLTGETQIFSFTLNTRNVLGLAAARVRGISAYLVPRDDSTQQNLGAKLILKCLAPSQEIDGKIDQPNPVYLEAGFSGPSVAENWLGLEELQNRNAAGEWTLTAEEAIGPIHRAATNTAPYDIVFAIKVSASHT